jgi:hypothetical protein
MFALAAAIVAGFATFGVKFGPADMLFLFLTLLALHMAFGIAVPRAGGKKPE